MTRALYATAAFLVLLGVGLFFALSTVDRSAAAAVTPPGEAPPIGDVAVRAPSTAAPSAASGALVVDSNMFSPSRTPPRVRFTLRPAEAESVPAAPRAPATPALRVYGITLRSTDSTALIDADPRVPGAEIYRVGDALPDGNRIARMTDSTVIVDGVRGQRVLRLEAKTRP